MLWGETFGSASATTFPWSARKRNDAAPGKCAQQYPPAV